MARLMVFATWSSLMRVIKAPREPSGSEHSIGCPLFLFFPIFPIFHKKKKCLSEGRNADPNLFWAVKGLSAWFTQPTYYEGEEGSRT